MSNDSDNKYRFDHGKNQFTTVPDMLLYAMENHENLLLCNDNGEPVTSNCKICNKEIEINTDTIVFCVCAECRKKLKKLLGDVK